MTTTVVDASGSVRDALGSWPVTTVVTSPRLAYRTAFELALDPPVPTARFAVDPAATVFEAAFRQVELNAPATSLRNLAGGTAVACELEAPREVRAVGLAGAVALDPAASYSIALYRVDRDVPAPKPTVTAPVGTARTATIPAGFTDARFAVMLQRAGAAGPEALTSAAIDRIGLRASPSAPRVSLGLPGGEPDPPFWQAPGELHTGDPAAQVHGGAAIAAALQRLLDAAVGPAPARVAVTIESDAPCELAVTAFDVRLGFVTDTFAYDVLADVDVLDGAALVRAISAGADPVSTFLRSKLPAAGASIGPVREALDELIRSGELYDAARFERVELRAETRAWLAATGDAARAVRNRLLLEDAYPGTIASPADKRVLRFPPGRIVGRETFVSLPAGASVDRATMRTSERLRDERPADVHAAVDDSVVASRAGLHVNPDSQVALRVAPSEAATASAVALAMLPIEPETLVDLEIQEDWEGAPSGRVVGAGRASLARVGDPAWATTVFDDPFVLDAKPYWLALRATPGSAVWLAEPAETRLRALRGDSAGGWESLQVPDGLRFAYRILSPAGPQDARPTAVVRVAGTLVAGIALDGFQSYDLAAALDQGVTADAAGPAPIALRFEAAAGSITAYPPRIEYRLTARAEAPTRAAPIRRRFA